MNRFCRCAIAGAFLGAAAPHAAAAQLSAEHWLRPGSLTLTAELGGAAFSDFQRGQARPVAPITGVGDFQRRVSARTSMSVGAAATWWIGPAWGVRIGGAFTPSRFSVWNEEYAEQRMDPYPLEEERTHASLGVWLGHAAVAFRFPHSFGRVVPYGLLGTGVVHYRIRDGNELPPEARTRFARGSRTAFAAVLGAGGTLPLRSDGVLLNFELTNHLVRTPLNDSGRGERFELAGVPLELSTAGTAADDDDISVTSNLRLTVGLSVSAAGRR